MIFPKTRFEQLAANFLKTRLCGNYRLASLQARLERACITTQNSVRGHMARC